MGRKKYRVNALLFLSLVAGFVALLAGGDWRSRLLLSVGMLIGLVVYFHVRDRFLERNFGVILTLVIWLVMLHDELGVWPLAAMYVALGLVLIQTVLMIYRFMRPVEPGALYPWDEEGYDEHGAQIKIN